MENKVFSKCGNRCDLYLIYRPNVMKNDRRKEICEVYSKIFEGFNANPNTIICDGCSCEKENPILLDPTCKVRKCVIKKSAFIADIATNIHVIFFRQNQHRKSLFRKLTLKSDGLGKTKS